MQGLTVNDCFRQGLPLELATVGTQDGLEKISDASSSVKTTVQGVVDPKTETKK